MLFAREQENTFEGDSQVTPGPDSISHSVKDLGCHIKGYTFARIDPLKKVAVYSRAPQILKIN